MVIMASSPSSSPLQFSNPFPSSISPSSKTQLLHSKPLLSFSTKAQQNPEGPEPNSSDATISNPSPPPTTDDFENRLARLRYRSGTGKKAEQRKGKKSKKGTGSSGSGSNVFLPPVPLKEPVSGGMKVSLGFEPYAERLNGKLAGLGLVALLLVELGSGKSVISYHTPGVVFLQMYFVGAVAALFVKYEKEKVSVWPTSSSSSSSVEK